MDVAAELEEEFDDDVTVERSASRTGGHDGAVRYTVYCDAADAERVRERLADLEAELAFETRR